MKKPKSKYTKEMIQEMLLTNPKALARGIVAIYRRQTPSEQAIGVTQDDNGQGFTGVDGRHLDKPSAVKWALEVSTMLGGLQVSLYRTAYSSDEQFVEDFE